jgi:hypothetical protein
VRDSLTALYRRVSGDGVARFAASVRPEVVEFPDSEDPYLGAQRIAGAMVRHLGLPDARMVVSYRDMPHAGSVELAAGPEYFVELNSRFREDRRDVGAALAHEVTHVYLHRLGMRRPELWQDEILTDTAAAYLGAGWLLLDAYREEPALRGERITMAAFTLGYLTPEEFGYVLAKRALTFGDDIEPWFTSPQARDAYRAGLDLAHQDLRRPPLAAAPWPARRRYAGRRDRGVSTAEVSFDGPAAARRVAFPCPTCFQRIRVPCGRPVRARCGLCHTVHDCDP